MKIVTDTAVYQSDSGKFVQVEGMFASPDQQKFAAAVLVNIQEKLGPNMCDRMEYLSSLFRFSGDGRPLRLLLTARFAFKIGLEIHRIRVVTDPPRACYDVHDMLLRPEDVADAFVHDIEVELKVACAEIWADASKLSQLMAWFQAVGSQKVTA